MRETREQRAERHNFWGLLILIGFFLFILVMAAIEQLPKEFPIFIRYIRDIWRG